MLGKVTTEKVSQIIIMYFIVTVKFHCAEIQDTKN